MITQNVIYSSSHRIVALSSGLLSHGKLVRSEHYAIDHQRDERNQDEEAGEYEAEDEGGAYGKAADDDGGGFAEGSIFVFHGANV